MLKVLTGASWYAESLDYEDQRLKRVYCKPVAATTRSIADTEDAPLCNNYIDLDMDGYHNSKKDSRTPFTQRSIAAGAVVDIPMLRRLKSGRDGSRLSTDSRVPSFKGVGGGCSPV